jgi:predicted dehydrogenase
MGEVLDLGICYAIKDSSYLSKQHWANSLPGGMIFDYLPHQIYLSLAIIKNVKRVSATCWKGHSDSKIPNSCYKIELGGESGGSTIFISHQSRSWRYNLDIACSEGSLSVDFLNSILLKDRLESLSILRKNLHSLGIAGQFLKGAFISGIRPSLKRWPISHRNLIERFIESVKAKSEVPVPPSEARETIRILEMVLQQL